MKNRTNVDEFKFIYDTFNDNIYGKKNNTNFEELFFDKYLSDNKEIEEKIVEMLNTPGSENFISAPTGSGKTYSIISTLKDMVNMEYDNKNNRYNYYINILAVPAKSQALQIREEYGVKCLVADSEDEITIEDTASMVYDKAEAVIELLKAENVKARIIIDEAHLVCMAAYRSEAIAKLMELVKLNIEKGGSVIYITASWAGMAWNNNYKKVLFCEKRNNNKNFKNLNLYVNSNSKMSDFVLNIAENRDCLIRYNNKEDQKKIANELRKIDRNVFYLNSDEKDSITIENETIYKNKMMNDVINYSILPKNAVCISTSLLDAGTNIVGIGSKENKPENFEAFYVINTANNLNLLSIEQFSNRLRFETNNYNLIINKKTTDEEKETYYFSLDRMIKYLTDELKQQIQYLELEVELLRNVKYKGKDNIEERIEEAMVDILQDENNFDKQKNSFGGSITYSIEGGIEIDYKYFLNYCLEKYYIGLYHNREKFIEELEKIFEIKVNIIEDFENNSLKINEENRELIREKFLEEYENGGAIFPAITYCYLFKEALKYKKITNKSIKEAVEVVLRTNSEELEKMYDDISKTSISSMTDKELDELDAIINNEKKIEDIEDGMREKINKVINNENIVDKIKKTEKKNITIEEFRKYYCTGEDEKTLNAYIKEKQIIKNNNNFLLDERFLMVHSAYDQLIVLQFIKNVKNYKIITNNSKIDKIDELIEELKKKTKHVYTRRKLVNFIKQIFTYREVEEKIGGKKVKVLYLNSIKTKIK